MGTGCSDLGYKVPVVTAMAKPSMIKKREASPVRPRHNLIGDVLHNTLYPCIIFIVGMDLSALPPLLASNSWPGHDKFHQPREELVLAGPQSGTAAALFGELLLSSSHFRFKLLNVQ